ncbi:hypothetical protein A1O3_06769 [Capronia epimyces CBS 606.96]|uniref:Uncharacterized protein n=1 Tax=Capronia epimyces CBS 606.96 TaxID=1182542 RepID=W9XQY7_9EURO|nr:uncharacterized protein A1O3_06769 [Capronia epimyces CBS 606.96]EXJ82952.1 hypothetical protein A1O3_06769 [Capronia epimyces CBS 606.96]
MATPAPLPDLGRVHVAVKTLEEEFGKLPNLMQLAKDLKADANKLAKDLKADANKLAKDLKGNLKELMAELKKVETASNTKIDEGFKDNNVYIKAMTANTLAQARNSLLTEVSDQIHRLVDPKGKAIDDFPSKPDDIPHMPFHTLRNVVVNLGSKPHDTKVHVEKQLRESIGLQGVLLQQEVKGAATAVSATAVSATAVSATAVSATAVSSVETDK